MKRIFAVGTIAIALAGTTQLAQARGCIKGAIVGGIAGHMVHHGLAGAMAGCAISHHREKVKDRRMMNDDAYAR